LGAHRSPLLKTFAAINGTPLRWLERNCRFFAALRANGFGFDALNASRTRPIAALRSTGFASFAPLGLVLEALVGEKHLLAGRENEFSSTFRALQDLIVVFHCAAPLCWERTAASNSRQTIGRIRLRLMRFPRHVWHELLKWAQLMFA